MIKELRNPRLFFSREEIFMNQNNIYEKALLSATDLCSYLNVGISTSYKLLITVGFPTVKIGTRKYANKELLDKWLMEQAEGRNKFNE